MCNSRATLHGSFLKILGSFLTHIVGLSLQVFFFNLQRPRQWYIVYLGSIVHRKYLCTHFFFHVPGEKTSISSRFLWQSEPCSLLPPMIHSKSDLFSSIHFSLLLFELNFNSLSFNQFFSFRLFLQVSILLNIPLPLVRLASSVNTLKYDTSC